jgi:membrane-associated phospholipid phosphatase
MVGMGGLTVISFLIIQKSFADNEYIFALSVISSGMVGTSRIYLDAHEPEEVYMGFLVGMSSMFISLSIFS